MKKTTPVKPQPATMTVRVIKADSMASFLGFMANPDEILTNTGEALSIYREMKADGRVKSLLKLAKAQVTRFPINVDQGEASPKVDAFVRTALKTTSLDKLLRRLIVAFDYGYSVVEVVWRQEGANWLPDDLVSKKPERFAFDEDGALKLKKQTGVEDLSNLNWKFLIYRHDKEPENPYGTSLLKSAYWPWKFKKAGLGFWLAAAEKFAVPSILALFDSSDSDEKVLERAEKLSTMLAGVSSGSSASLANVRDVKILGAEGNLSEFRSLMDWCDTQIAYALTGQNLATGEAEFGSRAQSETHQDTLHESAMSAIVDLTEVLQRLIDWIVELNFGPGIPAPRALIDTNAYANWEQVQGAINSGIPVSKQALYGRYGLPEPKDEEDAFVGRVQTPAGPDAGLFLADTPAKKKARAPLLMKTLS